MKKPNAPAVGLSGRRVCLRPPRPSDCDEFIRLMRASVGFYRGLVSPAREPEQFVAYLKRCRQPENRCFLICRKTEGAIVGAINLGQIFRGSLQSAYLGYYIGAPFAGQGYMTEALQLMLHHAFRGLNLHRVEANIQPGNAASIALVKRAGFTLEGFSIRYLKVCGRWRDHERWALLVEDWHARQSTRTRSSA